MKLIIANWKMHPETPREAAALAEASDVEGLVIAPPFPFLEDVARAIKKSALGSQDVAAENPPGGGPFTGEVSANELKSLGARSVIVGHSERRRLGETDEMVAQKVRAALNAGIIPILCVGESAEERAAGKVEEIIARELRTGLSLLPQPSTLNPQPSVVVAYEPIWAIGSGTPDTPQDMVNMVQYIKGVLADMHVKYPARVIYGGSVTGENAESFLKEKAIDGALVGGASLKPEEIKQIVEIALRY